jgi:hypothetical protein
MSVHDYSIDDILSKSWDRKIAHDLVAELEAYTGERPARTQEMRQFPGRKAYQELLERVRLARGENRGPKALGAVAHAMRDYALERPALSACAFRTPTSDCPEWREAYDGLCDFMKDLFAECGLHGSDAELVLCVLRSLVRGFVVHECMSSFMATFPYDTAPDRAVEIFLIGVSTLAVGDSAANIELNGCQQRRP